DAAAAQRGQALFIGKGKCSGCHTEATKAEPGWSMHTADEIGIDDFQAQRGPDGRYRTTPLHGAWAHAKGGSYHDAPFPTLLDLVDHYDSFMGLGLADGEKSDL